MSATERIKVVCHGCGARFQVRASKVQGRRFRATCKKCGGIIVAHCSNAFTVLPDRGSGSPRQSNPLQLERDDLYPEEEASWYVVISGKPHGPLSTDQVRQSFEVGRVTPRSYLWRAGDPEWRRLGEVPEFMDLATDAGATAYYQGPVPNEATGATRAAGPAGFRRQQDEPLHPEDPTQEKTAFYLDPSGQPVMAGGAYPEQQAPPAAEPQWRPAPAPAPVPRPEPWEQVPVIPPRPAVLPAPTGASRPGPRPTLPGAAPPAPARRSAPDHTRPLSPGEKVEALGGEGSDFRLLPSLAPAKPDGGPGDLPPPPAKSVFSQSLRPVGPPAGPALLAPAEEPFWTTGKIAAAAAIGGGLAVAMAVVVVVSVVRPKPRTVVAENQAAGVSQQTTASEKAANEIPIKVEPPAGKAKPEPAKAEQKPARAEQKPAKAEQKPARAEQKPARAEPEPAKPKVRRPKVRKKRAQRKSTRRVTLRKRHSRAHKPRKRSKAGVDNEVDALLSAAQSSGAKKKPSAGVDPDALLSAGGGTGTKKPRKGPDPDALLAAAQKPAASSGLSKSQVRAAMRGVVSQVRACYDKYQVPGQVKVRFTVQPSGASLPRVVGKFAGTPTGFCVLNAARSARFPSFSGAAQSFVYPFQLR